MGTSAREEATVSIPCTRSRLALLGLLIAAAAGLAAWMAQPDPRLVKAQLLQQRLASDEIRHAPPEQERHLRAQLESELRQLSPAQQRILDDERRRLLIEKIDRYRTLSKAEQIAFLDEEIDRLMALRREEERAAATPGADGDSPRAMRHRVPGNTPDERERFLKQQLDATTPEQRAKLSDIVKRLVDRAKERGLVGANFPDDLQAILALLR